MRENKSNKEYDFERDLLKAHCSIDKKQSLARKIYKLMKKECRRKQKRNSETKKQLIKFKLDL